MPRNRGPAKQPAIPELTAPRFAASPALKAELLREIDLFDGLSADDVRDIAESLPVERLTPGAILTSPDDEAERLFIIKRGRVRVYRLTSEGEQLTLDILGPGRIVGRMRWLQHGMGGVYAEAIDETLICYFTPEELQSLLERHPIITINIVRYLNERLEGCEAEREMLAFASVEQRLAARLLALARQFGRAAADGAVVIDLRLTHQELAGMIGTTRETTSAAIARLRRARLIEMRNQQVVVRDIRGLQGRSAAGSAAGAM